MICIVCVDNANGMMFNHRRQSRDNALIDNVISLAESARLFMSEYSAKLFGEKEIQIIPVEYDEEKVKRFLLQKDLVFEIANNHPDEIDFYKCDEKRRFCRTCEYLSICEMQKYNDDVYDEHIDFEGNEKYLSYLEDAEDERLQKLNQMV